MKFLVCTLNCIDLSNPDDAIVSYNVIKLPVNFQGENAGGLEIHTNSKKFFIKACEKASLERRGSYGGSNGKNGIWIITKTSGDEPRLTAHFDDVLKFEVHMSDEECSQSDWKTFWSRDVANIKFSSADSASAQFQLGNLDFHKI